MVYMKIVVFSNFKFDICKFVPLNVIAVFVSFAPVVLVIITLFLFNAVIVPRFKSV